MIRFLLPLLLLAEPQSRTMTHGAHRIEISLERMEGTEWRTVDPALVLQQGDRVRFRFRANFDAYLYVTNQSTSGKYEQLFPREETGQDNRISADRVYQVPATSALFRIAGPAGHEVVYWLLSPSPLAGAPAAPRQKPLTLIPRCDDSVLKARGDCLDNSAGLKLTPRGEGEGPRDLLVMRTQDTAVISSPAPLTGPLIYEFHLAHR
jgi:hypothetical protein